MLRRILLSSALSVALACVLQAQTTNPLIAESKRNYTCLLYTSRCV